MEFKDSNIDWVSQIPVDWTVRKLKYILTERIEKNNPIKTRDVLSLTAVQGVVPYSEKKASGGNKQKEDLSNYKLAYPNDIVVNSMNIVTGSVGLSNYYGCVSPVYYMFYTDDDKININYYNYIFKSRIFQRRLIGFGNGILQMTSEAGNLYAVRMKIPIDKFKSLLLPVPPIETQNDIVNYLDDKTIFIDEIIEKYKKLTQILEEKRAVLINQVVTKGLNLNVSMKNSNIEWIGEIPNNWEIRKFGHLIKLITKGATPTSYGFDFLDEGINFIKIESIAKNGKFIQSKFNYISEECNNFLTRSKMKEGDLLFSIAGALGRVAIVNSEILPANTNQALSIIRLNNDYLLTEYAFYALKANYVLHQIDDNMVQSAQANLSMESIREFKLLIPPIHEQKEIIKFLNKETEKIDDTLTKIKENIDLLYEYKTSLIHHAVTGKIDVRGREI